MNYYFAPRKGLAWQLNARVLLALIFAGAVLVVIFLVAIFNQPRKLPSEVNIVSTPSTPEILSTEVKIVGPVETVFESSKEACEPEDIPDNPARAFRDAQGRVQLILSHYTNRRMVGPDLNHLIHQCDVIMRSDYDPNPARFDDHEWIASIYSPDGTTVYALIHEEFQGNTHANECPSGKYLECWYNTITLAASTDGGNTYTHLQPPTQLVANIPYPYVPDSGPIGIFGPSNIIYNQNDHYFYVLLHAERYRDQQPGVCLARTTNLADPASWRAWDGSAFNVRFINPYLETSSNPLDHVCQPVSFPAIEKMSSSLTFNTYFNRFLLVGAVGQYDTKPTKPGEKVAGIYYSLSSDLIHWSPRQLIMKIELPWTYNCGDNDPVAYPAVLDPNSSSRNFETTGKQVYLYFTQFHYKDCQINLNRDLVRVPIEFFKLG